MIASRAPSTRRVAQRESAHLADGGEIPLRVLRGGEPCGLVEVLERGVVAFGVGVGQSGEVVRVEQVVVVGGQREGALGEFAHERRRP